MISRMAATGWIIIGLLFVAVLAGILDYFDIYGLVLEFLAWLKQHDTLAPFLFILVDMLVVVLVLPGVILTLGAGFLFGVIKGTLYVVIATTTGAMTAFLIARYLFGSRMSAYFTSHPRLRMINDGLASEGWKIVLLTRLIPFFPFKLSNYFFGLTHFSLRGYFFGTLFGIIPITMINVYVGSLAADLAGLGAHGIARTPLEWLMYGVGLIIGLGTLFYIMRLARKALNNYIPQTDEARPDNSSMR